MDSPPSEPRGFHQFQGRAPDGTGPCYFAVAKEGLLKEFRETGNRRKLLEGYLLPEVLDEPTGVWQDLKRPGQEQAYCYAGKPSGRYVKDTTIHVPCPPKQVFVVYVAGKPLKDGQLKVIKWTLGRRRPATSGIPR
jgi:hypothetical protein